MKGTNPEVLLGELEKGIKVLSEMYMFFEQSLREDVPKLGRSRSAAVLLAGIIDNYYTGIETMFFRISQFFENSLSKDRWHSDLLQRMMISVKGERVEVIRETTFICLDEIRRFLPSEVVNDTLKKSEYWNITISLIEGLHKTLLKELS